MCHAPMMSVCLCACVLIIMLESLTRQLASSVFSFSSSQSLSFVVVVVCVCGGVSLPPPSLSLSLLGEVAAEWRVLLSSRPVAFLHHLPPTHSGAVCLCLCEYGCDDALFFDLRSNSLRPRTDNTSVLS